MVKGASLSHLTLLITCNLCVTTRGLHAIPRNTSRNHSGIFAEIPRNYAQYPRNFADLSCRVHVHEMYRMAGNFRGVLIFVIDSAVTKISTHEN